MKLYAVCIDHDEFLPTLVWYDFNVNGWGQSPCDDYLTSDKAGAETVAGRYNNAKLITFNLVQENV